MGGLGLAMTLGVGRPFTTAGGSIRILTAGAGIQAASEFIIGRPRWWRFSVSAAGVTKLWFWRK